MMVRFMNWLWPTRWPLSTAHLNAVIVQAADASQQSVRAASELQASAEESATRVEVERGVISGRAERRTERQETMENDDVRRMAVDALARLSRSH